MVEKWLIQVEETMLNSMRMVIKEATEDYPKVDRKKWVLEWPGQVVICSSQIYWTLDSEHAIENGKLGDYLETCNNQINDTVALVRGELDIGARITLGALIVIDVHGKKSNYTNIEQLTLIFI